MRIYYHLSPYISHRKSGLEYIGCLRAIGHDVITDPQAAAGAELAVLHDEPGEYGGILGGMPALARVRRIAFCVWENEILPEAYISALRGMHAIWTPSSFSLNSLLSHFPQARLLPHVVRRILPSPEDLAFARKAMGGGQGECVFFSIVDSVNPRKNLQGLLRVFARLRSMTDRPVRLVLKQYRSNIALASLPGVVGIEGDLTEGQMAALHICADAYVSAHHSEGWGLGLSQTMAYGKPVIATGYSGNMEYMDEQNSLPVTYSLVPVSREMEERLPLFSQRMFWAQPDEEHFAACMLRVASGRVPPSLGKNAADICRRYGPQNIRARLRELLAEATV